MVYQIIQIHSLRRYNVTVVPNNTTKIILLLAVLIGSWCCAPAEYAAKKAALQEERKRREAERTAAKEAEKQKLVETMERIYLAAVADTDARTAKEVKVRFLVERSCNGCLLIR